MSVFSAKPNINAIDTTHGLLDKVHNSIDIASKAITRSKNLCPPVFLKILGAIISANIEKIEPKAKVSPTNSLLIKEDRKLEFI